MKIFIPCYDGIPDLDLGTYAPVQSGTAVTDYNLSCVHDNDKSPNISDKNELYRELCVLQYSAEHLVDDDNGCYGIEQGKRFMIRNYGFLDVRQDNPVRIYEDMLSAYRELLAYKDEDLDGYDMIAPCPQRMYQARNTLFDNWCHFHDKEFVLQAYNAVKNLYPDYTKAFETVFFGDSQFYIFHNIFITRGSIYKEYAKWLIGVLSEVEKNVTFNKDIDVHYNHIEKTYKPLPWLSEHLINVFVLRHRLMVKYNYIIQTFKR